MTTGKDTLSNSNILVETEWLEQNLTDPNLRIFDCTVDAGPNPDAVLGKKFPFAFESGRQRYNEKHIPGAGFIGILEELSDKSSPLPLMMPPEQQLVETLSKCGIGDNNRVVLYSTSTPMWAARVWMMLRAIGFDNVALLNGGWAKWTAEKRPVTNADCSYPPAVLTAQPRPGTFVGKDEVLAAIRDDQACIINALPPEMFAGTGGPAFGRKGRIAGSVNVPMGTLHDPDTGVYLPADQLHKKFGAVGAETAERIITYCGGGIASANNAFALALLGYDNVAVYDASMFEWGNDETLPMETD